MLKFKRIHEFTCRNIKGFTNSSKNLAKSAKFTLENKTFQNFSNFGIKMKKNTRH